MGNDPLLKGRKLLLVDDEDFTRSLVVRMLIEFQPEKILQAPDGQEAIALLNTFRDEIAIVICDFRMPKANGLEVLKYLRTGESGLRHNTPFIMLTGHTDKPLVQAAVGLDVDAFLVKPVSKVDLTSRLKKVLSGGGAKIKPKEAYMKIDVPIEQKKKKVDGGGGKNAATLLRQIKNEFQAQLDKDFGPMDFLALDDIPAGSILTQDLKDKSGALLLAENTMLNADLIGRLKGMKDGAVNFIWVRTPRTQDAVEKAAAAISAMKAASEEVKAEKR